MNVKLCFSSIHALDIYFTWYCRTLMEKMKKRRAAMEVTLGGCFCFS